MKFEMNKKRKRLKEDADLSMPWQHFQLGEQNILKYLSMISLKLFMYSTLQKQPCFQGIQTIYKILLILDHKEMPTTQQIIKEHKMYPVIILGDLNIISPKDMFDQISY